MKHTFASFAYRLPRLACASALLLLGLRPAAAQTSNVVGWGDNDYGQLGNGSMSNAVTTPIFALTAAPISAIATGEFHTVALRPDGTVWAWGNNGEGQLGDGATTSHSVPIQVRGTIGKTFLTNVTAIAAGDEHTVALKSDGTVWTWGDNGDGQIGDGTTTQRNTPTQVVGPNGSGVLTGVTAIAAGNLHTVALKSDSTVWTWGYNVFGGLGDGSTTQRNTPTQVKASLEKGFLKGVTAIAAGAEHTVALKSDGTVWTWGGNQAGELDDGTTTNRTTPVQAVGPNGSGFLTGVTAIAAGGSHTVALKSDGTVWAWGFNNAGGLGNGTTTNRSTPAQVLGPNGSGFLTGVQAIAAGGNHTVALLTPLVTISGKVTLEYCVQSQQAITFVLRPTNNATPLTRTQTLAADGSFSFSDIPSNTYNLALKGALWLRKVVAVDATGGSVTNIMATLLAGDGNNDNSVDAADFGLLVGAYNGVASIPGSGYDPEADFNCDGMVDVIDFSILVVNYKAICAQPPPV